MTKYTDLLNDNIEKINKQITEKEIENNEDLQNYIAEVFIKTPSKIEDLFSIIVSSSGLAYGSINYQNNLPDSVFDVMEHVLIEAIRTDLLEHFEDYEFEEDEEDDEDEDA